MEFTLPGLTVLEQLSSGPVRTILRARQADLGREVCVICLAPGVRPDSQLGRALKREADAYAALDHPNIPQLYDFRSEGAQAWLVLEATGGRPLGPPLGWRAAVAVALEAARALEHAHGRGVVHGRVALEHLSLTPEGEVKLQGFGLAARGLPGEIEPLELAQNAGVSPEGTLGQPPSPAGDVFGMGCVLFELLSARSPFGSIDGAVGLGHDARVRAERVPSLLGLAHNVPPALDLLTRRCLEKRPSDRPESMADLVQKLELLLDAPTRTLLRDAQLTGARPSVAPERKVGIEWPSWVRAPRVQGVALGVLFAAGVATAIVLARRNPSSRAVAEVVAEPAAGRGVALRVVATPWAHVSVDGVRRETTPFASPILLSPGKHEVRLEHPAAAAEIRHIDGQPGENVFLDVVLRVERPPVTVETTGPLVDDSP